MQKYKNLFCIISCFIFFSFISFLTLIVNSNVTAQEINQENLNQITNKPSKLDNNYQIPVGDEPVVIKSGYIVNEDKLYVANYMTGIISVISTENDTKIKDIPVGVGPTYIFPNNNELYVANEFSNNVSVISTKNDTKIKDIPVGDRPTFIATDNGKLYVANSISNTISVISTLNDTKIGEDIPVGDGPSNIFVQEFRNAIYVTNRDSDGISVIDGVSNKVVGRVSFDLSPSLSGYIECGNNIARLEKSFYLDSGITCKAIPNKGFEFLSWEQNIGSNATQLVNVSKPATALESILDIFNLKPDELEATLKVSTFGSYIASFKELPPPLPAEYWATLFGFVLTTGLGVWLIPSFVRWTRTRADTKKSNYYYQKIKLLYDDGNLDENDIKDLDKLKADIADVYSKGMINERF